MINADKCKQFQKSPSVYIGSNLLLHFIDIIFSSPVIACIQYDSVYFHQLMISNLGCVYVRYMYSSALTDIFDVIVQFWLLWYSLIDVIDVYCSCVRCIFKSAAVFFYILCVYKVIMLITTINYNQGNKFDEIFRLRGGGQ